MTLPDFESGNNTDPPVSMNFLLSHPFCWNSTTTYSFIHNVSHTLKVHVDLKEDLAKDSWKALRPGHLDWTICLGKDWEVLRKNPSNSNARKRNNSGTNFDTKSVADLIRLIRNKREHEDEIPSDYIDTLGWHPDKRFDLHCFVSYWTSKFPKLIPFIWSKLYFLRNESIYQELYPCDFDETSSSPVVWTGESIVNQFVHQLNTALGYQKQKGYLHTRYNVNGLGICSNLEFHLLNTNQRTTPLRGCITASITGAPNAYTSLSFTWVNNIQDYGGEEKKSLTYETNENGSKCDIYSTTMIPVSYVENVNLFLELNCIKASKRLVILLNQFEIDRNPSLVQGIVQMLGENGIKLTKNVVKYSEVRESIDDHIFNGNMAIMLQDKKYKVSTVLPKDAEHLESCLLTLEGDRVNEILQRKESIKLFESYKPPSSPKFYVPRTFCTQGIITSKVLRHRSKDRIFVTGDISYEKLVELVNPSENVFRIHNVADLSRETIKSNRIMLIDLTTTNYRKILSNVSKETSYNLHCIEYIGKDSFKWLYSQDCVSLIVKSQPKKEIEPMSLSVEDFLTDVEKYDFGPIFLADKPGMGKSFILNYLGHEISKRFKNTFVLYFNMTDLLKRICSNEVKDINEAICSALTFKLDPFETNLLRYLLQETTSKLKFELLLDALDEVELFKERLSLNIISLIVKNFPAVRVWVTVREYMQEYIEKEFKTLVFKLNPLDRKGQVEFLSNFWSKMSKTKCAKDNLKDIAGKCLSSCCGGLNSFTGIPLHCNMLAEIFSDDIDKLVSGKSDNFRRLSLVELYENMVKLKIDKFLQEKLGVPNVREIVAIIRDDSTKGHMFFALKLLFPNSEIDKFAKHFSIQDGKEDEIKKYGFIDSTSPIRFTHRSFAEYFSAVFIHGALIGKYADFKWNTLMIDLCSMVFEVYPVQYTYNYKTFTSDKCPSMKNSEVCYFIDCLLEQTKDKGLSKDLVRILHDFSTDNFIRAESVILGLLRDNYCNTAKQLINSLNQDERFEYLEKTKAHHTYMLEVILRRCDVDMYKFMISLIEDWYKVIENKQYEIPFLLFKLGLRKGKCEFVKFMIEEKGFDKAKWEKLLKLEGTSSGIIHLIISKSRHESESVIQSKKELLRYFTDLDPSCVEYKDAKGRTPILLQISQSFELKEYLIVSLKANANAVDKYNNSALHWMDFANYAKAITPKLYHRMLKCFMDNGFSRLNFKNNQGLTPLFVAVNTFRDSLLPETVELFHQAGANFNDKTKSGATIIEVCKKHHVSEKFIETITSFMNK